jgi:hypothetical protein
MASLEQNHTVVDAVASLIESGISGTLEKFASETVGKHINLNALQPALTIRVMFEGSASFALSCAIIVQTEKDRNGQLYFRVRGKKGFEPPLPDIPRQFDLWTRTHFTHWSIMSVANLLKHLKQ